MRLVKLSDLSEEERKKALEEQQARINSNNQERFAQAQRANQQFNEYVNKYGEYVPNKKKKETLSDKQIKSITENVKNRKTLWDKVEERLSKFATSDVNRLHNISDGEVKIVRNSLGQIDKNATILAQAQKNTENTIQKEKIRNSAKAYLETLERDEKEKLDKLQKKLEEQKDIKVSTTVVKEPKEQNNSILNIDSNNVRLATSEEVKNAKTITSTTLEAMEEAKRKNENIKKGGIDAFNEYVESVLNAVPGGAMSVISGIGNTGTTLVANQIRQASNLAGKFGQQEAKERLENTYDDIIDIGRELHETGNYHDTVNSMTDDKFTRYSTNVVSTVSKMLTSSGLGTVIGVSGGIVQGMYVGGQSAQEVLNENKDNINQATITGLLKGYTSYLTEKMFDANILTKGGKNSSIQNLVDDVIAKKVSSKFGRKLANKTVGIIGENIEEFTEDGIDMLIDNMVNDKGYTFKDWLSNVPETVQVTTISTIIMNLMGLGGGNIENINNKEAEYWIDEAQKIIDKENLGIVYNQNELQNLKISDDNIQEVKQVLDQLKQSNMNIATKQQLETSIKDYSNNKNVTANNIQAMKNVIQNETQSTKNQTILPQQQITQQENKMAQNGNMEQINKFNGYTEREISNIVSKKITVANNEQDILNFVENSKIMPGNLKIYLGKVGKNISYKIKNKLGIDISNYNISLKTDSIRHTLKKHSSQTEFQRGQIPITSEDFKNIPNIVNNADIVERVGTTQQGKPVIKFEKNINDTNVVITYISDKHNNLELQTMYKFKNDKKISSSTTSNTNALDITSKTVSGTNFINNSITQNINPVKENTITNNYMQNRNNDTQNMSNIPVEKNQQTNDILNNKNLPMQNYQYKKSDNVKIDNLRMDASKYFNNSEKAYNYVNMLEKIIIDKNIDIRLDTNLKTPDEKIANGAYSNGVITINPNSNKTGEFIAIHELTHAIGTKDMIDMITNYRRSNAEFNSTVEQLLQNYKTTEINEEALADISSQLFGNQEFINDIAQENLNIFKKVYNEIKYLWHQFRGYKNQNQFVDDLYYKWTEAYNSNHKLNDSNNFLIEQNEKGKYVKADRKVISGNNPLEWETQVENYINNSVRKGKDVQVKTESGDILTITKDTSGKAKFRNQITDKNGKTRYLNNKEFLSKLTAETHIDELAQISQKINKNPVPDYKNHKFAKDGFDYRSAYFEDFDGQYYKITMSVGKNGDIDTIYNIGKMDKKNRSKSSLMAQRPSDKKITSNEELTSTNSIPSANTDVNTTTKYSMQESEKNSGSFSLPTKEWQEYLDENYKATGTRTNLEDINLQKNNTKIIENVIETENKIPISEKLQEEKIAKILEKAPEKVPEKSRALAIFKANILDKGIVFEELSRKLDKIYRKASIKKSARDLQGKWDYTLTSTARGQNAIGNTRYEFDSSTKTQKQISKSLEDIRSEVGEYTSEFQEYMYHQLNIDRMTLEERFGGDTGINYERRNNIKNKPVFSNEITAEISKQKVAEYEQQYPQFKKWAKDVYDYNNANKQELVKTGVISQEFADKLDEMYPHYVPIKRVDTKGNAINVPLDTNRTGINAPLKRATGGTSDIMPLFETMADRTMQTYRASARNSFGVELKNTLQALNQYQQGDIQQVDVDTVIEQLGNQESVDKLLQENKGGNPTFTVFENGEKITFDISRDMYDALKPTNELLTKLSDSKLSKGLNKISNFRRGVLTEYNPLFLITNALKDAQDVLGNSQHATKTYMKFPEAYSQIIQKGYWYNEYVNYGGEQNSYFRDGQFESDKKLPTGKKILKMPLDKISNINNVIEMAPRLAEYITSREAGRSIETSMLDASRVTTNFKAGGDITKFANRNGATFLNASVQGAMQVARNIQEANVKGFKGWTVLAGKTIAMGLPAIILNNLVWGDDDDYEELQDYVKDNYYCVAKLGDGKFIRLPKGRTTATIQKVFNNINEYVNKDKEINIDNVTKDFWEDILFAKDNLAPNNPLDNNVISPIVQVAKNKSWYGEDIVPMRLQDKPKSEQYDETTDSFSIWLGSKLNISPYKINYLLDQYGGGISDIALPMMTKQAENNVIEDKFTTDNTMKSKYPGEFFQKSDELKVKANSEKATEKDILEYKYMSSISEKMSDLYKQKREIQNSDKTDKEKKEKLKEVQKQINSIAKEGLENVNNMKINDITATINNKQYYKVTDINTNKKQWKELSDDEKDKNKNIPLTDYANYKEKVVQETIKQRKNGVLKEDGALKNKDKMNILLNSSYNDKTITAIYENYIKTSSSNEDSISTYDVMKSSGLNIKEWLKYSSQEFTTEKEDNGTLNGGKTIKGQSKKDKFINYINDTMKCNYNQRLLLYAIQGYSTSSKEKNILASYVNKLDLSASNKLKVYDKFSGFTVYKNGTVEW